jgi:hypothetical protein
VFDGERMLVSLFAWNSKEFLVLNSCALQVAR